MRRRHQVDSSVLLHVLPENPCLWRESLKASDPNLVLLQDFEFSWLKIHPKKKRFAKVVAQNDRRQKHVTL